MAAGRRIRTWSWVLLIAAVAILFLSLLVVLVREPSEPSHAGRSLSAWIQMHERATGAESVRNSLYNAAAMQESKAAILEIGTNALPLLIDWIQTNPRGSQWRHKLARTVERLPGDTAENPMFSALFEDPSWDRLMTGFAGFRILGARAAPAIPELMSLASGRETPEVAENAVQALGEIGAPATPALLRLLSDSSRSTRIRAAIVLGYSHVGTNRDAVVRALGKCLSDPDGEIAAAAARSLGRQDEWHDLAPIFLVEGLRHPRDEVRLSCARSLSWLGANAGSSAVIAALTAALRDSHPEVRLWATNALSKIEVEPGPD